MLDGLASIAKAKVKSDAQKSLMGRIMFFVEQTPSVQPKTGHWIEVYAESDGSHSWIEFTCPSCKTQFGIESGEYGWHYGDPIPWKACPMCGAARKEGKG